MHLEPSWLLLDTKVMVVVGAHAAAAAVGCYGLGGDGIACCHCCGAWIWWWL